MAWTHAREQWSLYRSFQKAPIILFILSRFLFHFGWQVRTSGIEGEFDIEAFLKQLWDMGLELPETEIEQIREECSHPTPNR